MSCVTGCRPDLPESGHYSPQRAASAVAKFDSCRCGSDFEVGVGVAPNEWDTGEPVFCVDRLAGASTLFRRQDADGRGEFGAGDFSADGARGDLHLRVVADALALSQFAARHEVEFAVIFGKPDGSVNRDTTFAEGREADVTLAVDFCGDCSHENIVSAAKDSCGR